MTPVLLDTGVFAAVIDRRASDIVLDERQLAFIGEAERRLVSPISFYEIGQKVRLGRWPRMADHFPNLTRLAFNTGLSLAPLDTETLSSASVLDWVHRDPFDRIIVATALRENATVVTTDRAIADYEVPTFR